MTSWTNKGLNAEDERKIIFCSNHQLKMVPIRQLSPILLSQFILFLSTQIKIVKMSQMVKGLSHLRNTMLSIFFKRSRHFQRYGSVQIIRDTSRGRVSGLCHQMSYKEGVSQSATFYIFQF